jgi:hypothetical protein
LNQASDKQKINPAFVMRLHHPGISLQSEWARQDAEQDPHGLGLT